MTHYQTAIEEIVSQEELAMLAAANGRCITATVTIPVPAQIRSSLNHTVREVERQLKETDAGRQSAELLEPLRELATTIEARGDWATSLAIYRSTETFRCFHLPVTVRDIVIIAPRFALRPLLPMISREQHFYLLALSQKHVRLFDCTNFHFHEIDLKGRIPQDLNTFLGTKAPDHVLENRSSGGAGAGSMKGVVFGTGSDREKHDEYMAHFFREIDRGLVKFLNTGTAPLMFAGVQEEVALCRRINTYKHLTEQDIHGSPDGVSPVELHRRALEIVRSSTSASVQKIIREFDSHRKAKRVSTDLATVLTRAKEGRVGDLLIREDADGRVADGEDLIGTAARETLANHGHVFAIRSGEIPEGLDVVAILRY